MTVRAVMGSESAEAKRSSFQLLAHLIFDRLWHDPSGMNVC